MKAGKIYAPDQIPRAIENFFKDRNLATLRELALREVAESLDRAASAQAAPDERQRASGRVMVCLSSNPPRAAGLLRRGSRLSGRLNTDWFVVYVETPDEAPDRIDSAAQRHLLRNLEKARELGAEVVRLKAADPVPALLDFARSHAVGHLIVGRSRAPLWQRLVGRSILQRLVDESEGLDLHIASFEGEEPR
jgi:two-component system sensor histidine kinase KdpD